MSKKASTNEPKKPCRHFNQTVSTIGRRRIKTCNACGQWIDA